MPTLLSYSSFYSVKFHATFSYTAVMRNKNMLTTYHQCSFLPFSSLPLILVPSRCCLQCYSRPACSLHLYIRASHRIKSCHTVIALSHLSHMTCTEGKISKIIGFMSINNIFTYITVHVSLCCKKSVFQTRKHIFHQNPVTSRENNCAYFCKTNED